MHGAGAPRCVSVTGGLAQGQSPGRPPQLLVPEAFRGPAPGLASREAVMQVASGLMLRAADSVVTQGPGDTAGRPPAAFGAVVLDGPR